eukprot:5610172-Pyramimonas_sp.AAC.1
METPAPHSRPHQQSSSLAHACVVPLAHSMKPVLGERKQAFTTQALCPDVCNILCALHWVDAEMLRLHLLLASTTF